ncbi:hypothetical protein LSCM1_03536 [Leishmania martiniquensis]|uniref:Uncharacterized protein n=1 Tax=Leishmania martiniquensis TaxID=1580590 RepID=A0A836HEK3_9TRYP|nr:hypothetical protein LSCM1_03536 [Leishmania martiniquensis]
MQRRSMHGRSNAASWEVALTKSMTTSRHSRQPVQRHARHSTACTHRRSNARLATEEAHQGAPQRSGPELYCRGGCEGEDGESHRPRPLPTSHAASGCSSSVPVHQQQQHHYDPTTCYNIDAAFTGDEAAFTVPAPPAPTNDAAHAHRIKQVPCSRAHTPRSAAGASVQPPPLHEAQARLLGSRRRVADSAAVDDRATGKHLTRRHRPRQMSPPSSPLHVPPPGTAAPTADIVCSNASPSRLLPLRRVPSRVRRLLWKLEAEAQRTGCTVTDAADGSRDTVELYRALFLQALADGAAWERHARALEAIAQASAKREARLTRQLRHARCIVELLAAHVESVERAADALSRGSASGAGASRQPDGTVLDRTLPMTSSALAETAVGAAAAPSCLWSPAPRSAVSELIRGSLGRSLDLVYGISGSDSPHEEDSDGAEVNAFVAADATARRTDVQLHAAVAEEPGGEPGPDSLHSALLPLVHRLREMRQDRSSWVGDVDDVVRGAPARYAATTARKVGSRGDAEQRVRRGGTEGFEVYAPLGREPPTAARAPEMTHDESTSLPPHAGTSAWAAAVLEGGAPYRAASPPPFPPSLAHATAIGAAMRTESLVHESTPLDAAAAATAPQPAPSSAARSLLELLRSRDASTQAAAVMVEQTRADTSAGTVSKARSKIAAAHHNVDYEVTVDEARRSRSTNDTAQSRRALPVMASSSSPASRPPLMTPSHSPIPRRSRETKGEGNPSPPPSLPSLASSSLPCWHSNALAPPSPPQLCSGCSSALSAKEAAAAAAPIEVTELVHMPLPAPFSFPPGHRSTHITDTHERDGSAAARSDGGTVCSSNYWDTLKTASFADDSGASSASSPKGQEEETGGEHERLVSSSETITDERPEVVSSDGYAEWRAQLEAHLNLGWASGR